MTFTISRPVSGVILYTYTEMDSGETSPTSLLLSGTAPIVGFMQVTGTFDGASVKLQVSNDNINWVDAKDIAGEVVGISSTGGVEFSTAAVYIRPLVTGGTETNLDVTVSFRG
jgi:hypothetical protein